jgi:hypothetical protein
MSNSFNSDVPCANGELTLSGVASAAIAVAGTYYVANSGGTTTLTMGDSFDTPASGRLRYTGTKTIMAHCGATVSFTYNSTSQVIRARAAKNGTTIAASEIALKYGTSGDVVSTALHFMTELATNDYIELFVTDDLGTSKVVTVDKANIFAVAIPKC